MSGEPHKGRVLLVGAGPGDPELLTLKAARAIAAADVILIDDLVDRRVLAHARAGVRVVAVGKRGGGASTAQAFINRLLIREAHAGHCVVRLKGGDPFLFGRGGEERDALRAAGIAVDVIPGITSGLAAPLAAGISVTHRERSAGVIFVTGHEKDTVDGGTTAPGGLSDRIDWAALAATGLTLVVYMGVKRAGAIQRALLVAGMPAATPVAAIENATLPGERVVSATLGEMAACFALAQLASPAILVIGDVAAATSQAAGIPARQALNRLLADSAA